MTGERAVWTAVLAPLDVVTPDGRRLAPGFVLRQARRPLPAPLLNSAGDLIGAVRHAEVRGGLLTASGTVDDPGVAARMGSGELRPQVELFWPELDQDLPADGVVVVAGTLATVVAGSRPAWEQAQFTIGGER